MRTVKGMFSYCEGHLQGQGEDTCACVEYGQDQCGKMSRAKREITMVSHDAGGVTGA